MPFYSVVAGASLETGSKPCTVVEILKEAFDEDFHKAFEFYTKNYARDIRRATGHPDAINIKLHWLSEPRVESSISQKLCSTSVDLIFQAVFNADLPKGQDTYEQVKIQSFFRMRYLIDLVGNKCSAPMMAPLDYFPEDLVTRQDEAVTNRYLLPVMHAGDYAVTARKMLERYYPEALDRPIPVNGYVLAGRMGLKVYKVRFEKGSDIQGRIYFAETAEAVRGDDGGMKKIRVPAGTILINKDLCWSPEVENSTIIHECAHMFLDLHFFRLQMLGARPFSSYTSRKKKKRYGRSPVDWMERQAEKLPAYILMDEDITRSEIERLLQMKDGVRSHQNMRWVMEQLAGTFRVTRSMAKYRMIELGYREAEGIYKYISGKRIPDHGCAGEWGNGITYVIALPDAAGLMAESPDFDRAVRSGDYAYVEGHFCLNSQSYIEVQRNREKRLTAYARSHIDECCIAFTVSDRYSIRRYEQGKAARKTPGNYLTIYGFGQEATKKERDRLNETVISDAVLWTRIKKEMPENFKDAVCKVMKAKGVTQEELGYSIGVSRAALRKWINQEKPTKYHVAAICIALDVRGDIGEELMHISCNRLYNTVEDNLLQTFLYATGELTVSRANEIMRQAGFRPLASGMDDSRAS